MAAMLKICLGLSLLGFLGLAFITLPTNASGNPNLLGGKIDVPDVQTNPEIQELGRFCVQQINLQRKSQLQGNAAEFNPFSYLGVMSAQKQVVAGTKYYLRIAATLPDGSNKRFDTVVVIQPWLHHKKLLSYTPVPATNSD